MIWVIVFVGIALAGLISAVSYAVWLAHKASDLYSEVRMLGRRFEEAAILLGGIGLPAVAPTRIDEAGLARSVPGKEGT